MKTKLLLCTALITASFCSASDADVLKAKFDACNAAHAAAKQRLEDAQRELEAAYRACELASKDNTTAAAKYKPFQQYPN